MAYIGRQPDSEPSRSHQAFYGFKLDNATGSLTVDIIDNGSIKLPDSANVLDNGDYRDYFWSQSKLTYQWGSSGHIEVVYK